MNISVSPFVVGLIITIIINFFISLSKSKIKKKIYILVSSILTAMGVFGVITIRPMLTERLNKNFVLWATRKFDLFAVISIIATFLAIIILLYLLFTKKNSNSDVWSIPWVVNAIRLINFIVVFLYSMETISKRFDLASYLLVFYISEFFILYIPIVVRRIVMLKRELSK